MTASINCIICGSIRQKYLWHIADFPLLRCINCGLQFLDPQPSNERLSTIYSGNYFVDIPETDHLKKQTANLYLDRIARHLPSVNNLKLLEIGCGQGNLLLEARRRGFEIAGIEYSSVFTKDINEKLGGDFVQASTIDSCTFENNFDIIVANDVIEHVRKPGHFLKKVASLLKPEGLFFCATPSLDSWSARLMGKHWMEYKEEHLYYFKPDNFILLLKKSGFNNIKFESNFKVLNLNYIVAHFRRYDVPLITNLLFILSKTMPSFILRYPFQVVASGMEVFASVNRPSNG